jgi:hypothetical protein
MRQPGHAEHGVVGPTGQLRSGPRGRVLHRRLAFAALLLALAWAFSPSTDPSGTEALFASHAEPQHNSIEAAIWTPDPPAVCGDLEQYAGVVYGTMGDDVLYGGNHPQIIMGLDGNDTIYGGNSGDCLVGGPGNDRLIGGNSKDILLGGTGDDFLDGGNSKDYLDGEDDADDCDGGNGKDDVVNCDTGAPIAPHALSVQQPPSQDSLTTSSQTMLDQPSEELQPSPVATTAPVPTSTATPSDALDSSADEAPSAPGATP